MSHVREKGQNCADYKAAGDLDLDFDQKET